MSSPSPALQFLEKPPVVYSAAAEAGKKRTIDEKIVKGGSGSPGLAEWNPETYLKELIRIASNGKREVRPTSTGLQFFMIKGGAEGFLPAEYRGKDASRVVIGGGVTTSGAAGTVMTFDNNDLIAVFDKRGQLLSAALLSRPLSITNPNIWTEHTANKIYDAWDGQSVSLYHNRNFDIKYYGLMIWDKLGWYSSGKVRVDLHKEEATNGCVFIKDPDTPDYTDTARLNAFEPQFIRDVQAQVGAKVKSNIGKMYVIKIA